MTPEAWGSLAIQIPLVLAFIWYSREMQKQFTESLDRRDAMYETRNNAIVQALNAHTAQLTELTKVITAHDARSNEK